MSSLIERLPGHLILFVGIVVAGIAALSIYVNYANIIAWAILAYGLFSMVVGVAIIYR